MEEERTKQIGIVGLGKMGISHLAIANQTPGLAVKAICDSSKPLLKFLKKNTNFECFSDYKEMINKVSLDGVLIIVPNSMHFELAQYSLEAGLHVFIEKPFTMNYDESERLVELANKKDLFGQVGYVNRFSPIFQKVKHLLDQEILGTINNYMNSMVGGVVLKPSSKGWRNDYSKGGGCLYDYGPHCLDLSNYLFGHETRVKSAILKKVYSSNVDDIVYATLVHQNEVLGFNYINWSDSSVRKATNKVEIFGSKGKIVANKQELKIFLEKPNEAMNLDKGWNEIFVTDLNTEVPYFLRGEEFSRQLLDFSKLLNGQLNESTSSFSSASVTDKLIGDILRMNKN